MMTKISKNFFLFLTIILSLTIFLDIERDEIQPWDEGIYSARIKAAAFDNLWFDQTEQAIGGLYSSAHPPLVIWSNAIFVKLFGNHEFAFRIGTALFGAFTIILFFFFFDNNFKGFLASLLLATSSQFIFYSQHTQLDIPLTFFILLGIFFWLKYEKCPHKKYLIYTGIAFGLGLWTKIIVATLIPMIIATYLLFQIFSKKKNWLIALRELLIILSIGITLFLPWFIFMLINYGNEFINYYFFYHIIERSLDGVEHNTKNLGYFFYINQLMVHLPLAVAFILIFWKKKFDTENIFLIIAILLPLLLFSIAKTKLATYILPIFPIISILAIKNIEERSLKLKLPLLSAILLLVFQIWSYLPIIRNKVKSIILLNFNDLDPTILIILLLACLILIFLYSTLKLKFALFVIFALQIVSLRFSNNQPKVFNGIKYAAEYFTEKSMTNLVHIRPKYASEVNNPQIIHYFNLNKMPNAMNYHLVTDSTELIDFERNMMIIKERGINFTTTNNNYEELFKNDYYSIYYR